MDITSAANWAIFWSVAVIFVVIEALLIYTAIRFRHRSADGTTTTAPDAQRAWQTDLAWTLLPALMTAVLLFFTFQAMVNRL
jgi:heme/copper-type cytochrome/quinol oxidase subunit 2